MSCNWFSTKVYCFHECLLNKFSILPLNISVCTDTEHQRNRYPAARNNASPPETFTQQLNTAGSVANLLGVCIYIFLTTLIYDALSQILTVWSWLVYLLWISHREHFVSSVAETKFWIEIKVQFQPLVYIMRRPTIGVSCRQLSLQHRLQYRARYKSLSF